jgi:hypothetical protein
MLIVLNTNASITTFFKLHLLLSKKRTQNPCTKTPMRRSWKSHKGTKWANVYVSPSKYRVNVKYDILSKHAKVKYSRKKIKN